jgi:CheY-like chemotaxis protein/HPt (histidine-containing phosphotransfer) domain-containing protein
LTGRILIAEDNQVNQRVVMLMLTRLGLRAQAVADGREALLALASIPFDLVLMDCQMPEMDGFSATIEQRRREQANPGSKRIPIIALTANALREDRERCLAAGMDDHLAKPITMDVLTAALNRWLTPASAAITLDPHVDVQVLDTLADGLGDDGNAVIVQLIDDVLSSVPELLTRICQAHESGQAAELHKTAHRLAGTALSAGLSGMVHICRHLERLAKDEQLSAAQPYVAALSDGWPTVITVLLQHRHEREQA